MGNLEEILNELDQTDIFVLFISNDSLNSAWVEKEISEAVERMNEGSIKRFFPIVIDKNIKHDDPRIPDWVRENYNLRPITRPVVASRRIRERMLELSWKNHPILKQRNNIFVGRNEILELFEERTNDISKDYPKTIFSSGLREIGRKSTVIKALQKANIIREYSDPIRLNLTREDGIEGFIEKLSDLGMSEQGYRVNLLDMTVDEKVNELNKLILDILSYGDVILIEDNGSIVRFGGEIAPWYVSLCEALPTGRIILCVAPYFRPNKAPFVRNSDFFFLDVPELTPSERAGLFKRYGDLVGLALSREQSMDFVKLFTGYPGQVTYAVDLISSEGIAGAWKKSYEIAEYSKYKAGIYVDKYLNDPDKQELLRFMASFDFLSIDFISDISDKVGFDCLANIDDFIGESVCERIGSTGEYVRLNDVIRDYVNRNDLYIGDRFRSALSEFVVDFMNTYEREEYDVSAYYVAIKEALTGDVEIKVPDKLLIPAHFLRSMNDLYRKKKYHEIINLADRVLAKKTNYDDHTEQDIRYFLCQSLARLRDKRFLSEVQSIKGAEHNFLMGFYYRLQGRYADALERFELSKEEKRTRERSLREIVMTLSIVERYEEALTQAKMNYERYPSNPFIIQSFFECLIHQQKSDSNRAILEGLIKALDSISGDKAAEINASLKANLTATYDEDFVKANQIIDDAIAMFSGTEYPLLTKLDLAIQNLDRNLIEETMNRLNQVGGGRDSRRPKFVKAQVILEALKGESGRALALINRDLKEFHPNARERLIKRVHAIVGEFKAPPSPGS